MPAKTPKGDAYGFATLDEASSTRANTEVTEEEATAESDEEQVAFPGREVVVALDNVHKTYLLGVEGVAALRGISLQVYKGEFVVLYGTSGGGKTSLLNIVGTIDKPTKGRVEICGLRVSDRTSDRRLAELRQERIGFVFQTFNLLSSMTALENVELPMILLGKRTPAQRRKKAMELFTHMGMQDRIHHLPSQLSGGEQQRVTIARALANDPEMLLLDEPTGDLDTHNSHIVMDLLVELNREQGITIMMVTHDLSLKNFGHRALWIRDGKLHHIDHNTAEQRHEALRAIQENLRIREEMTHQQREAEGVSTDEIEPTNTEVRFPTSYGMIQPLSGEVIPQSDAIAAYARRRVHTGASHASSTIVPPTSSDVPLTKTETPPPTAPRGARLKRIVSYG
eukprot:TRINITY_DN22318_c0_g1_i2.p1 TRINITY_DN22318_c0_g1~~TRINITY_DN22318_c0_g1_i2.p1  ORF type:complete len:396 (-),score=67.96 TRINITY_DN22318_c0_g1_i2:19-1206(-)